MSRPVIDLTSDHEEEFITQQPVPSPLSPLDQHVESEPTIESEPTVGSEAVGDTPRSPLVGPTSPPFAHPPIPPTIMPTLTLAEPTTFTIPEPIAHPIGTSTVVHTTPDIPLPHFNLPPPTYHHQFRTDEGTSRGPRFTIEPRVPEMVHPPPPMVEPPAQRRRTEPIYHSVACVLARWRELEGLRDNDRVHAHSGPDIVSAYTGEPVHLTVSTLVARLFRAESRLQALEGPTRPIPASVADLHRQVSTMNVELTKTTIQTEFAHDRVDEIEDYIVGLGLGLRGTAELTIGVRDESFITRVRIEDLETQVQHMEDRLTMQEVRIQRIEEALQTIAAAITMPPPSGSS